MSRCSTVNKINCAEELGAEVKTFPRMQMAPPFVKGQKAPNLRAALWPVSGAIFTQENLKQWSDMGVNCTGIGSEFFMKKKDGSYHSGTISQNTKNARTIAKKLKS